MSLKLTRTLKAPSTIISNLDLCGGTPFLEMSPLQRWKLALGRAGFSRGGKWGKMPNVQRHGLAFMGGEPFSTTMGVVRMEDREKGVVSLQDEFRRRGCWHR